VIPLRDANPTARRPVVTGAIIVACLVVFALELAIRAVGGEAALEEFFARFGVVPASLVAAVRSGQVLDLPIATLVTYQFLHGGWIHLGANLLYLWVFGNNVEDRLGRPAFLVFYLAGGVIAALAQVAIDPTSDVPLVGASGSIAAVLGAYFVMFPRARVLSLVFLVVFFQLIEVPAVYLLGLWFVLQLIDALTALGHDTTVEGVAIFAHVAGFGVGIAVGLADRRRRALPAAIL
jgi:membrane associated rhomboid family serine protease